MDMQISSLMVTPVITVKADATVAEVTDVLMRNRLSFVPVTECAGGPVLGIIGANDLLYFKTSGCDLDTVRAWQICAYKPHAVQMDAAAIDVARLMVERQVHHVVVMRGKELAGVVSSLDFLKQYIAQVEGEQIRQA